MLARGAIAIAEQEVLRILIILLHVELLVELRNLSIRGLKDVELALIGRTGRPTLGTRRKLYGIFEVHQRSSSQARQFTFLAKTRMMSFFSIISSNSFMVNGLMLLGG